MSGEINPLPGFALYRVGATDFLEKYLARY